MPVTPASEKQSQSINSLPCSRVLDLRSKRIGQIDDLVQSKGAHYSIFKRSAELMALFDVCKSFEENK